MKTAYKFSTERYTVVRYLKHLKGRFLPSCQPKRSRILAVLGGLHAIRNDICILHMREDTTPIGPGWEIWPFELGAQLFSYYYVRSVP